MDVAGQVAAAELPWGVRPLEALHPGEAAQAGDELADLLALRASGVPCAPAWLVALSGDGALGRLCTALEVALGSAPGARALLRPLFPTRGLAARFERRPELAALVREPSEVGRAAGAFLASVGAPEVTGALGGSLARLSALVTVAEVGPLGRAASADPVHGDPDQIRVWEAAVTPWLVDRRTTRVTTRGEGELDEPGASAAADLADRAQLVLGLPVEIGWALSRGRSVVTAVRHLGPAARFTTAPYRIVTLVSEDEGCVAPLAIDALDKAVRHEVAEPGVEPCVRRIYARPYRRMEEKVTVRRRAGDPASVARLAGRAGRVAAEVTAPLAAARSFERSMASRLAAIDAVDLGALDERALVEELRDRQRLVIEAIELLDRGRTATIGALAALEATVGALPRDVLPAVARPRPARSRRRLLDRMARLARRIESEHGELVRPSSLSAPLRRKWDELRRDLAEVRPLGIDVRPLPYGRDDDALLAAMRAAPWEQAETRERARKNALRRIMATARQRPFGRSREAVAATLALVVRRVAKSKGAMSEALASAMLRLRSAASEAGRRLADEGLLEAAEDALYLSLDEITQGLSREPGAYAARVRLRREDDLRWARYAAPRRIAARR